MRTAIIAFACVASSSGAALAADACSPAAAEQIIRDGEFLWAQSVVTGDMTVAQRIIADDYIGVAPHGTVSDKAMEVQAAPGSPKSFASNVIDAMTVRVFDRTAVVQGSESWRLRDGTDGRYVFIDTWVCRHGQWQIVAAADVIAAPQTTH